MGRLINTKIVNFANQYSLFDALLEGVQIIDHDFKYVYVNDSLVSQSGLTRQDLIGNTMMEKYPGIEQTLVFTHIKSCLEDRLPKTFLNEFNFKDGRTGFFELRIQPVPAGVLILSIDETERMNSIKLLEESNERFRLVSQATSDAIWDWNITERELFWGEGFRTYYGYDLTKILKSSELKYHFIHQDDKIKVQQSLNDALLSGKEHWQEEYRFKKNNGEFAYVLDKGVIIRDSQNNPVRMVGAMKDITERKLVEIELKKLYNDLLLKSKK